ncbi:MAG: HAMP domain-containing histidine kinase [Campylobacterales bacterium]|nr:HAMP domain-containing histidine kinase [Campylobacterales bacterium]
MNRNHRYILLFIFVASVLLAASLGHISNGRMPYWLMMAMMLLAGLIIGSGYVRHLIEPLEKRSNELELLSRQTLHELNIPVATILANTQMLLKKEQEDKNIKRLERIKQAASVLKTLYSELDYMIKKQIHKVDLEICDLQSLLQERILAYKEIFPQINFVCDLESSSVKIDTIGFLKVLNNLVHNAVKYSKPDSVVALSLKNMHLSIKDEGIGMEEDFLVKAFSHYYQEDSLSSGQGIGLGLVKEYCDMYKISIYVDSNKGQGTTISLDLTSRSMRGNS